MDTSKHSPREIIPPSKIKPKKGTLKIYIGFAPGVGKTYAMLNEANSRLRSGEDIVIGYVEAHNRAETTAQIGNLTTIPRKKIRYKNVELEEMDTSLIISTHPTTVLVDELAHTNSPGSLNDKRYDDVIDILNAGINVISTLNIQHIESLNTLVQEITGVKVRETIPDSILEDAELVLIDITPSQLQERLKKGLIYKEEVAIRALKNFFRAGNLNALRELSLRQIAEEVEDDVQEYKLKHGIASPWHITEKVMVCITSHISSEKLIRRGSRISKRFKCPFYVVIAVDTGFFSKKLTQDDLDIIDNHKALAKKLGATVVTLSSKLVYRNVAAFAINENITQLIIGRNVSVKKDKMFRSATLTKFLRLTKNIEVHIIPTE